MEDHALMLSVAPKLAWYLVRICSRFHPVQSASLTCFSQLLGVQTASGEALVQTGALHTCNKHPGDNEEGLFMVSSSEIRMAEYGC
jgi:hypothetical protein